MTPADGLHAVLRATLGVGTAAAGAVAYGSLVERNAFTLRQFAVPVLPVGAAPIRVLHLSDIHLTPAQERKIRWVRDLARLQPDMVVNTGDNLAHLDAVEPLMYAMEPFLPLPGAFVLGSNDYYAPKLKNPVDYLTKKDPELTSPRLPTGKLVAGLASSGWADLNNARLPFRLGPLRLELVGVDDPHIQLDRYDEVAGPRDPGADLTVGIMHAPYTRVLDAMVRDGAGMIIAGHTHGGQLALPFYGALVTNCDIDRRRAKGMTRWWPGANGIRAEAAPPDAAWMHVSAGLGTSPFAPIRFACRPEATLLALLPRDARGS